MSEGFEEEKQKTPISVMNERLIAELDDGKDMVSSYRNSQKPAFEMKNESHIGRVPNKFRYLENLKQKQFSMETTSRDQYSSITHQEYERNKEEIFEKKQEALIEDNFNYR